MQQEGRSAEFANGRVFNMNQARLEQVRENMKKAGLHQMIVTRQNSVLSDWNLGCSDGAYDGGISG